MVALSFKRSQARRSAATGPPPGSAQARFPADFAWRYHERSSASRYLGMSELPRRPRVRRRGPCRIEEVARLAGVAPITVSRALNKPETVSERTRAAVWDAVERTGYVPNRVAGDLASNSTRMIGVVLPSISNPIFAGRVQGLTDTLTEAGYQLLLAVSDGNVEREERHVLALLGHRVAGLNLSGTTHSNRTRSLLARAEVPIVETASVNATAIDMLVGYSEDGAAYAMVAHLAERGYRTVAFLSAPLLDSDRLQARLAGYERGVREFGLERTAGLIAESEGTGPASGAIAFADLLGRHPDLDAVFCTSDMLAYGCLLEAQRRGISVPDELGVAGFEDLELSREWVPSLTTVRVRSYELGACAARMLLNRIQGRAEEPRIADLGFELARRRSTARGRRNPTV